MTEQMWWLLLAICSGGMILFGVAALAIDIWCGPQSRLPSMPVPRPKPYPFDRIRKLELKDGDLVVINVDQILSMEQRERIKANITTVTDKLGHKVMTVVLEKGMDIAVVSKADFKQAHPDAACDWYARHKHIA